MDKYAVIVAGGKGLRMGNAVPKQFLPLAGKPILYYTLKAFVDAFEDINLVLVLPQDQLSYAQMVLQEFEERIDVELVTGGETRFHSVQNGLKVVADDSIVFVHDGVRPLVSPGLIRACYQQAVDKGSAIPAIPIADSLRVVDGENSKPVNRDKMRSIQTPQTFRAELLLPAFLQGYTDNFTDEATVVEAYGSRVYLIDGEKSNIKLTTPEDMVVAESTIKARAEHA